MVPVRKPASIDDQRLATLRFCEQELLRRREQDLADAWYWGIKAKVACYCARTEERLLGLDRDAPVMELTAEEQTRLLHNHAFLQERTVLGTATEPPAEPAWRRRLHERVARFVQARRKTIETEDE